MSGHSFKTDLSAVVLARRQILPHLIPHSSNREHGSPHLLLYLDNHAKSVSFHLCSSFGGNKVPTGKKMVLDCLPRIIWALVRSDITKVLLLF